MIIRRRTDSMLSFRCNGYAYPMRDWRCRKNYGSYEYIMSFPSIKKKLGLRILKVEKVSFHFCCILQA